MNAYDLETYSENEKIIPYCCCFCINNEFFSIYANDFYIDEDNEDIIVNSFLKSILYVYKNKKTFKNNKITFYIHNLNFDGFLILNSLTKNKITFDMFYREMSLYYIKFRFIGIFFEFKCSYKILPLSLEKIGFLSKIPKQIFPYKFVKKKTLFYIGNPPNIDYFNNEFEWKLFINKFKIFNLKKESINYCTNDVFITNFFLKEIFKIVKKFDKSLMDTSYSAPSISNKIFFKKFNNFKILSELSEVDDAYIRKSYFGGRCEVFGNPINGEIIHMFDFSGMYSQCMMEKFPIDKGVYENLKNKIDAPGFYLIEFYSDQSVPILPYKNTDNKLMFSNGNLTGYYWWEEIKLFLEYGGKIKKIHSAITYREEDYVFKEYVSFFNKLRSDGGYYNVFGKLMINSLYGSFAMNDDDTFSIITFSKFEFESICNIFDIKNWHFVNDCYIINVKINWKSEKSYKKNNWNNKDNVLNTKRNVTYASIISSKARIKLYKGFMETIKNKGTLYYCDTDSIFAGFKDNNLEVQMGEVKWSNIYTDAVFASPKCYALKNNEEELVKIKGISQKISFNEFKNTFYKNEKISFLEEFQLNKKNFKLTQNYLNKNINLGSYDKRIFDKDKKKTLPLN